MPIKDVKCAEITISLQVPFTVKEKWISSRKTTNKQTNTSDQGIKLHIYQYKLVFVK